MRKFNCFGLFVVSALVLWLVQPMRAGDYYVIPYDVDPPIEIDGNLDDWQSVPNHIHMMDAKHVTWVQRGKTKAEVWKGTSDLSAAVQLAWDYSGIYIAADVTDDIVQQPYRGGKIWKGDYVNLWLDMKPTIEQERTVLGKGQYHIGITPGNFNGAAGGKGVIPPSVFAFMPQNMSLKNAKVAARRTGKGYVLEAFIPFTDLGIKAVPRNYYATFEVAVSDSDSKPASQQMIMTSGTEKWVSQRTRLLPLLFGDGNGQADQPDKTILIKKAEFPFEPGQEISLKFSITELPENMNVFLFFKGRSHTKRPGGFCNRVMCVTVNGKRLEQDRLVNRPLTMRMFNGREQAAMSPNGLLCFAHEPAFGATDKSKGRQIKGQKVSEWEFNLDKLLKPGENTVVFKNMSRAWKGVYPKISVGDVQLRIQPRKAGTAFSKPVPTGPLPVYEPQRTFPKTYNSLDWQADRIRLKINGEPFTVLSRFSAPDGKWHKGTTQYFKHQRKVQPKNEWIIVKDTFTNLTKKDLPLMYTNRCMLGKRKADIWIGGRLTGAKTTRGVYPENPTVFGTTKKGGLGLVALNDEFRVHIEQNTSDEGNLEIGDFFFVLKPGVTYTAEWAIVPVTKPDFWQFINTTRRMMDVNFTLKYMFAFAMKRPPVYEWSDAKLRSFIDNKSANWVVQSNDGVKYKGKPARSTAWMMGPLDVYRDFQKRIRKLYPNRSVKTGIYYHCFLDTYEPNNKRFAADRVLDKNGEPVAYGPKGHRNDYMKLFIPTLENGFGKEIGRWIDVILDDIGADGVFWDEFNRSKARYCYNMWDGCSADIDRRTFKIIRRKCSVTLKSREFREYHVKRIMARGAVLMVNGLPYTRTLARHKFMGFTETGNITETSKALLYSPVALGDHRTEVLPKHAYRVMLKALNHGCLYAWYDTRVFPHHKMLTEYMYPFTPIELHSGYLIGQERIITNRSGLFGWNDTSDFTAHVYDRQGRETEKYKVKKVTRDGKTYAEVRFPGGYSAAIVRLKK